METSWNEAFGPSSVSSVDEVTVFFYCGSAMTVACSSLCFLELFASE
jgi:hypothetical protein